MKQESFAFRRERFTAQTGTTTGLVNNKKPGIETPGRGQIPHVRTEFAPKGIGRVSPTLFIRICAVKPAHPSTYIFSLTTFSALHKISSCVILTPLDANQRSLKNTRGIQ